MNTKFKFVILFFSSSIIAQTKIDTLYFNYEESGYKTLAIQETKNLIDFNNKIKKELNRRDSDLLITEYSTNIQPISIPVFGFKKSVLDFKDGDNLISFIDFKNDYSNQELIIFLGDQWIYANEIKNINYEKIEANYKKNLWKINDLLLKRKNYLRWNLNFIDFTYSFKDNLFFIILDEYCMVINGRIYVLQNEEGGIQMTEFNLFFMPKIDEIKKKTQGTNDRTFIIKSEDYNIENKIYLFIKK